mgnify:CR=1 FL=1
MDNYSKMEDIFKKKVEEHYKKYYNIDAVDENYEEKLLEGYDSLVDIVTYLKKRLNIKVDTLMSKNYITNKRHAPITL